MVILLNTSFAHQLMASLHIFFYCMNYFLPIIYPALQPKYRPAHPILVHNNCIDKACPSFLRHAKALQSTQQSEGGGVRRCGSVMALRRQPTRSRRGRLYRILCDKDDAETELENRANLHAIPNKLVFFCTA